MRGVLDPLSVGSAFGQHQLNPSKDLAGSNTRTEILRIKNQRPSPYEGKRFLAGGLHQPVEDLLQPRFCLLG